MDFLLDQVALSYDGYCQALVKGGISMEPCNHCPDRKSNMIMKPKKVVIWGSEDILSSSVELFITAKKDWDVVSICNNEGMEALIQAVENSNPDIVVIVQEFQNSPTVIALRLLRDHPAIKVILLSLENNLMDVYSKQKILTQEASDLITAIEKE